MEPGIITKPMKKCADDGFPAEAVPILLGRFHQVSVLL